MTQPAYAPPPPPTPPPSPLPVWARLLGVGCGAVLLLASIAGITGFAVLSRASAGPEKTVQAFLAAAAAADWATAHAQFSAGLKEAQPYDEFSTIAAANQRFFQVQDTTFNNRSVNPAGAELSGSVTLTDGSQLPASFKLVKEEDEWRLISYQIGN